MNKKTKIMLYKIIVHKEAAKQLMTIDDQLALKKAKLKALIFAYNVKSVKFISVVEQTNRENYFEDYAFKIEKNHII